MASAIQLASLGRRERNLNINVGSFNPNKNHSDKARWTVIYPAYLNSKKTLSEGRRIPIKNAVENPTLNEIKDVLVNAGFQIELEVNKTYPRELNKHENLSRGRIRVHLKNDDNNSVNANFPTSKLICNQEKNFYDLDLVFLKLIFLIILFL
jgi:signal recognition particle subunit SEC65